MPSEWDQFPAVATAPPATNEWDWFPAAANSPASQSSGDPWDQFPKVNADVPKPSLTPASDQVAAPGRTWYGDIIKGADLKSIPLDVIKSLSPISETPRVLKQAWDVLHGVPPAQAVPESQAFVGIEKKPLQERLATGLNTALNLAFAKGATEATVPRVEIKGGEVNAQQEPIATSVPSEQVRPSVDEGTPLRQQGETAQARQEVQQPPQEPIATEPPIPEPREQRSSFIPDLDTFEKSLSPADRQDYNEYETLRYKTVAGQGPEQGYKPYKLSVADRKRFEALDAKFAPQLRSVAESGQLVWDSQAGRPLPAAVVERQQFVLPKGYEKQGDLYVYQPEGEVKPVEETPPETSAVAQAPEGQAQTDVLTPTEQGPVESTATAPAPPEPVPQGTEEPMRLTGTKAEVVDAERTARGLEPIMSEVVQSNPETMTMAEQRLTQNPAAGKVLVDELLNGTKRDVSEVDEAVLLREKITTQNARQAVGERALDPALTEPERVQARQEFDTLESHLNNIDQATYRSGQIWGRLGQFRQRLAAEDYSLAAVEQRWRIAKGGQPLTPEESAAVKTHVATMDALAGKIDARRRRLEQSIEKARTGGQSKPKAEQPTDTEIEALQTELKRLRATAKESQQLPQAKARVQKRIAEVENRIKEYGYAKPTRPAKVKPDRELLDLQYQWAKTKEKLDRGIFEASLKNQTKPEKIFRTAGEVLSLPRALKASMDLSAVRRQGGLIFMGHPIRSLRNFGPMLKAAKSEKGFFEVMQEIRDRPNAPEYRQSKLSLTDIDPTSGLSQMEEVYMSRWANAIPLVNHSQRAYVAFLNRLRADSYDALKASLGRGGEVTPVQSEALSKFINVFTGRGTLSGKYADAAAALNQAFFAPRYVVSRMQAILGQPIWRSGQDMAVRKLIAKEYARTLIGYGVTYGLIGMALEKAVDFDPRSSDFGKIKLGNTRIDLLSGLAQQTVLLSRLATGRTKTQSGEVRKIYGQIPYGNTTAVDVGTRFLRSKLAPVPSSIVNYLQGTDFAGNPVTLGSSILDLTVPLSGSDIYDAMKEQGVPAGAALGVLSMFGDGVQTYSPRVSGGAATWGGVGTATAKPPQWTGATAKATWR